jgi:hypothetical protein
VAKPTVERRGDAVWYGDWNEFDDPVDGHVTGRKNQIVPATLTPRSGGGGTTSPFSLAQRPGMSYEASFGSENDSKRMVDATQSWKPGAISTIAKEQATRRVAPCARRHVWNVPFAVSNPHRITRDVTLPTMVVSSLRKRSSSPPSRRENWDGGTVCKRVSMLCDDACILTTFSDDMRCQRMSLKYDGCLCVRLDEPRHSPTSGKTRTEAYAATATEACAALNRVATEQLGVESPRLPGTPARWARVCGSCGSNLHWKFSRAFTTCPRCFLAQRMTVRCVDNPVDIQQQRSVGVHHERLHASIEKFGALLGAADYRWCYYRKHPTIASKTQLIRFDEIVAVINTRTFRWMRASLLTQWKRRYLRWLMNEADVAAHIIDWLAAEIEIPEVDVPGDNEADFPGCDHYIPEWGTPIGIGRFKPASITVNPSGRLYMYDSATSAFARVAGIGRSPLNAENIRSVLRGHPHGDYIVSSILEGYSLQAITPDTGRWSRDCYRVPPASIEFVKSAARKEMEAHAFVQLPKRIPRAIMRGAPFFAVPKSNGSARGVSDFSAGKLSVNELTRRSSFNRARLAKLERLLDRIVYLKTHVATPGEKVLLVKLDVARCFRQFPSPIRDFLKTVHFFGDEAWCNTMLSMGHRTSGDGSSVTVSATRDKLADEGIFCETFIDDLMMEEVESKMPHSLGRAKSWWKFWDLPPNDDKELEEGPPSTSRIFLGLMVDTEAMTVSVSTARAQKLITIMTEWLDEGRQRTTSEYSKLAGQLAFATTAMQLGKPFLRPLYLAAGKQRKVKMSRWQKIAWEKAEEKEARQKQLPDDISECLRWWLILLNDTPRAISFDPNTLLSVTHVYTDASGIGFGCTAPCVGDGEYIHGKWYSSERNSTSISIREAAAAVLAIFQWGSIASGGVLIIHTDNSATHDMFMRGYVCHDIMASWLRIATVAQTKFRCRVLTTHIPGVFNTWADSLSRMLPLPPECDSWRKQRMPQGLRELCWNTLSTQPWDPKPGHHETAKKLLFGIFSGMNVRWDTLSPCSVPWTSWKRIRQQALREVVCSTSCGGLSRTASTLQQERLMDISHPSANTTTSKPDGSFYIPSCCRRFYSGPNSYHENGVLETLPTAL